MPTIKTEKTELAVSVLVSRTHVGAYDFTFHSRLIRQGKKTFLLHDEFCGMGTLEGGCPRTMVYLVPESKVERVTWVFEHADDDFNECTTEWSAFVFHELPDLAFIGRAASFAWSRKLVASL